MFYFKIIIKRRSNVCRGNPRPAAAKAHYLSANNGARIIHETYSKIFTKPVLQAGPLPGYFVGVCISRNRDEIIVKCWNDTPLK